jgi:hypothetical protein
LSHSASPKMLFQKGHFEVVLRGARPPVFCKMMYEEATCSP